MKCNENTFFASPEAMQNSIFSEITISEKIEFDYKLPKTPHTATAKYKTLDVPMHG